MFKALHGPVPVSAETVQSKSAAMLDPSVAAAILTEAPTMYIADASGRMMITRPRLEALHRAVTAGSSDAPLSH